MSDQVLRAVDGRLPGRRGLATRQRLLACTRTLLENNSYRELRVVDIAREAGTSPATFYQYFADVTSAILALAEELATVGGEQLTRPVREGPWRGTAGYQTSARVADAFIEFWDQHWPIMRVIDLSGTEGDGRFRDLRTRLLNQFTVALSEVVAEEQAGRRNAEAVDPMAVASVLVSMLAHVAAHRYGFEFYGIRTDDLRTTMTRILFTTVTGRRPPTGGA